MRFAATLTLGDASVAFSSQSSSSSALGATEVVVSELGTVLRAVGSTRVLWMDPVAVGHGLVLRRCLAVGVRVETKASTSRCPARQLPMFSTSRNWIVVSWTTHLSAYIIKNTGSADPVTTTYEQFFFWLQFSGYKDVPCGVSFPACSSQHRCPVALSTYRFSGATRGPSSS